MALDTYWETPPEFAVGEPFSARLANIMQNDLRWLYGSILTRSMPATGVKVKAADALNSMTAIWRGWYRHREAGTEIVCWIYIERLEGESTGEMEFYIQKEGDDARLIDSLSVTSPPNTTGQLVGPYGYGDIEGLSLEDGDWIKVIVKAKDPSTSVPYWLFKVGFVAEKIKLDAEIAGTWTTPPTITDGNVSSAAEATIWSEDLTWLYNRIALPNYSTYSIKARPFASTYAPVFYGFIQYVGTTLHWRMGANALSEKAAGNPKMKVSVNNTQIFLGSNKGAGVGYDKNLFNAGEHSYDMTGLGLTLGNLYPVEVEIESDGISGYEGVLYWMYQDDLIIPEGWQSPVDWSVGDYATGSTGTNRFDYISDNLTWLYNRLNTNNLCVFNFASRDNTAGFSSNYDWPQKESRDGTGHVLMHRHRWFHWFDDKLALIWEEGGTTASPATQKQQLEDPPSNERMAFDLLGLNWLKPGMIYRAEGDGHWSIEDLTI